MTKKEILKEIERELKIDNLFNSKFKLVCVSEGIVSYEHKKDDVINIIDIIADDSFFRNETPNELMNKLRIKFFQHAVHIIDRGHLELIGRKTYSPLSNIELN